MSFGYVIMKDDGMFVAMPGSAGSYTSNLLKARRFLSRGAAENERCVENETVVSVASLLPITEYK